MARLPALAVLVLGGLLPLHAQPLVDFPTANHALADGNPQGFFMYVDRNFEGEKSKPWQGGQFGYVRGPVRSGGVVKYIQLHEGIDILPLQRDPEGNPLDIVKAAAAGTVVHISPQAGASNYGRYVVIENRWDGSPYYTLYAHLNAISVQVGQKVAQGSPIGVMGFTGAGINRERAHVHFEVCLLLSENFEGWHSTNFPGNANQHGVYNGLNLVGVDPARLLMEARNNPALKITDSIRANEPAFKITVKNTPNLTLISRYPWLVSPGEVANPPSWTITFSRHGVPPKAEASTQAVDGPVLAWVKETKQAYSQITKGLVSGPPGSPRLTDSGIRFGRLLTWPD